MVFNLKSYERFKRSNIVIRTLARSNTIILIILFLTKYTVNAQNTDNPCLALQEFKIVVLGSSTAAGAGASNSDSAWVNRYRNFLLEINSQNEVINLAVGGFTSYRIMPTGFIPPSGRPQPDTTHNITKAISFQPDAIIVNLPSNDISLGFSLEEQIYNLDSVFNLANANNIPIWISTTQPKNSSTSNMQLQAQMRDSIFAHYQTFAIDFWTTLALADNSIDSTYDSGDGTHLNDAGHNILFERVKNTHIPDSLFMPSNIADYGIVSTNFDIEACGDQNSKFEIVITNTGINDSTDVSLLFLLENLTEGIQHNDSLNLIGGTNTCLSDTQVFFGNTSVKGNYNTTITIENTSDTNLLNNFQEESFKSLGRPTINLFHDTLCFPDTALLEIDFESYDTAFWYHPVYEDSILSCSSSFVPGYIDSTSFWYAEVVRGNLFYKNQLFTTQNSNINWNGTMFDLIASEDIIIDSLEMKIATTGWHDVELYYKQGSYMGFETDTNSWSLLDTVHVFVIDSSEFVSIPIDSFTMHIGDTSGIYIQMKDPGDRLSYHSIANITERATPELSIITGSGISHNWSGTFFPRDWNGRIFYHYGYKPTGECSTGKIPVYAYLSETELDLGNDTTIGPDEIFTLSAPNFQTYLWSDGSTDSFFEIYTANYGDTTISINLLAIDSLNCQFSDTIEISIINTTISESELRNNYCNIFPNPSTGKIKIETTDLKSISIYNTLGKEVYAKKLSEGYDLRHLPKNIYLLKIESGNRYYCKKLLLK